MSRLRREDISFRRVFSAGGRRVGNIGASLRWKFSRESALCKEKLAALKNTHENEVGWLIANGPSLRQMDLAALKNQITIGMNRIYLHKDIMGFIPRYYVCVNELLLEQFHPEIAELSSVKFINWKKRFFFGLSNDTSFIAFRNSIKDSFRDDLSQMLDTGGTVTFVALQLAYFLGLSKVIIVGLDHSFADIGTPNSTQVRNTEEDLNHFHPNYFPKGSKWQLPDLKRSELSYELARAFYENNGRKIIDATIGGKCEVFEKANYIDLLKECIAK